MATPNSDLSYRALDSLKGNWGESIAVVLIYCFIAWAASLPGYFNDFFQVLSIFLIAPLWFGMALYFLKTVRGEKGEINDLFFGFNYYLLTLGTYILITILTFLWTLLFVIPGIIKALSYSMTPYVLVDNPSMRPMEAIDRSMEIMDGHKWKLFVLGLWFFVVSIGCVMTLGIGFIWAIPYMQTTLAEFYEDIKFEADPYIVS